MEKKTIGGFIAVLRKANGMTQKDLAEKLNVSDKSVSRWERDDGAPDLSLIPVIAEVFGVTCDELLKGERQSPEMRTDISCDSSTSQKGEKQKKRLLAVSLSKFKTRTFISVGVSLLGLIAALICNFGFLRAYIGFFAGAVFFIAATVCEAVFINSALLSVSDDSLSDDETGQFKRSVIKTSERFFAVVSALFFFTLPLILLPYDTYLGIEAYTLFTCGAVLAAAALLVFAVVCWFLNASFIKKGVFTLSEKEAAVYIRNHILKRNCALVLIPVMLITVISHVAMTEIWGPWSIMEGTEFNDYESFVEYMEQDIPRNYSSTTNASEPVSEPIEETYYDINGMEISRDEAMRRYIRVDDGSEDGKIVCEYIQRNENVCSIQYRYDGESALPITVFTYDDLNAAKAKIAVINVIFAAVYIFEVIAVVAVYFHKRIKK